MLVLISFGLVLVATVLLVVGLLQEGGVALIYVSIACSIGAGIVLFLATRSARPQAAVAGGGTVGGGPDLREAGVATPPEQVPVDVAQVAFAPPAPVDAVVEPTAVTMPVVTPPVAAADAPVVALAGVPVAPADTAGPLPGDDDDDFFPIADYDDLRVAEILPLLPELYEDELDIVEERERGTKNRASVLNRIAQLRAELAPPPPPSPPPVAAAPPLAVPTAAEPVTMQVPVVPPEPMVAGDSPVTPAAAPAVTPVTSSASGLAALKANDLRARLPDLSAEDLIALRQDELDGQARVSVLDAIDRRVKAMAAGTAPAMPPAARAAAKAAKATRASTKAAATKATPAKKRAPAKASPKAFKESGAVSGKRVAKKQAPPAAAAPPAPPAPEAAVEPPAPPPAVEPPAPPPPA